MGFIGFGNMGQAIIKGMLGSKIVKPKQIIVFDHSKDKLKHLSADFKINHAHKRLFLKIFI